MSAFDKLRAVLNGNTLKAIAGIADAGATFLAQFNADDGDHVEHDGNDVLALVKNVLTESSSIARLFIPMNILWRKPQADETCMVLQPADGATPGMPYALYGDAGEDDAVPPWFETGAGLYAPEDVYVQSVNGDVTIDPDTDDGKIYLTDGATQKMARKDDPVDCGTLAVVALANVVTLTYTPPTGAPSIMQFTFSDAVVYSGPASVPLVGKIQNGSGIVLGPTDGQS